MELSYSYKHAPTLLKFAQSDALVRGVVGPIGSGKSVACGPIEIWRRAMQQEPDENGLAHTKWLVVRASYPQLKDTTIPQFTAWLPEEHYGKLSTVAPFDYLIEKDIYDENDNFVKTVKCDIFFRSMDKPSDISKIKSFNLTGAFANEAIFLPWEIIENMMERCRRFPANMTWGGFWADTNPCDTDNWWYRFFEENRPPNAEIFHQPGGRSPEAENIPFIGKNYYTDLATLHANRPGYVNVMIDGNYGFVQTGSQVFPDFSHTMHVAEDANPVPGDGAIYWGQDYGLTPCAVFLQALPGGRVIVYDEIVSENMGIQRFAEEALIYHAQKWPSVKHKYVIADPAGSQRSQVDERTCFQEMNSKLARVGLMVEPGLQGLQIRLDSIRYGLTTLLRGRPALLIHPRCKTLIKALAGKYQFRRLSTAADKYSATPDKTHPWSDIVDALAYPLTLIWGGTLLDPVFAANDDEEDTPSTYQPAGRSIITGY